MRKISLLILSVLVPLMSLSQDLNGRWSGMIYQKIGDTLFSFNLETNIVHKKNNLSGKAVVVQTETKNYSVYKFIGSVREGKIKINPSEIVKIDFPQPNFPFLCFSNLKAELKIDEVNNKMIIEGENYGVDIKYDLINERYFEGSCPKGTFKLSKNIIKTDNQSIKAENPATLLITDKKEILVVDDKEIILFTKTVKIEVWDSYDEDGDLINLYLNGNILFSDLKVSKKGKRFDIDLQSGENIIEVEALNEGTVSPNTSAIKIFVDEQQHEIILSAKKGERDSLKIILE
ncbi:hypothetical protein [Winogradskyella sp.]|uniref:hypothetical protein n=1 Tax=Winogradskyella sp. TaxID=1883156 RepID=UPI002634886B|nr:hypothetical protein [Winogradskyella sp.]